MLVMYCLNVQWGLEDDQYEKKGEARNGYQLLVDWSWGNGNFVGRLDRIRETDRIRPDLLISYYP